MELGEGESQDQKMRCDQIKIAGISLHMLQRAITLPRSEILAPV
jgi:hypothetical protein